MVDFIVIFLHLFSAIIFIGYVFVDAILCYGLKQANELKKAYFKSSGILYALSFVILILSGIYLAYNEYTNFANINKIMFFIKIALVILMLFITFISIYIARFKNNKEHFLVKQAHILALIICFLIVLFAKLLSIL
ncbi:MULTISPECIES: hypothetical protein [unclassified Campylobacter]|uniref:hypothetical protein n=1 Tax=unclassified Campylobacter TaxID=2593542 RepID=UPI001BDB5328|nr:MULTISPECIES: hypothetical protein [unclassified Campylobacter]MBZ7976469.1 hypothetical protein [Campylobacter sp. RM12637]MBZ7978248.1 hypothetical protein [Campylobacter sp. RM12654]MBZ7980080.1 hypothetical protein [Campylobacter sp. RM12642]MBZ7991955.1 hypothetical protein [Campylobacter sp. RM9331]MBZ8005788.1 hypothetical protein [Campylobacter sp. RM9332]